MDFPFIKDIPETDPTYRTTKNIWESFPDGLKKFWIETQNSIRNAAMIPTNILETYPEAASSLYAFTAPMKNAPSSPIKFPYLINVAMHIPAKPGDVAHEVAHLYLHAVKNYPFIWDHHSLNLERPSKPITNHKIFIERNLAARVYDVIIHPLVDKELQIRNLLSTDFESRMIEDAKMNLKSFSDESTDRRKMTLKNINSLFLVEYSLRLNPSQWGSILKPFEKDKSISELNTFALKLNDIISSYGTDPSGILNAIKESWRFFNLRQYRINMDLLEKSPIL